MATGATQPFRPAGTISVAASVTSTSGPLAGGGSTVLIFNASGSTAFVRLGATSDVTALLTDTPVPAGARMLLDAGPFVSYGAAVLSNGTGQVYFTVGDGDSY